MIEASQFIAEMKEAWSSQLLASVLYQRGGPFAGDGTGDLPEGSESRRGDERRVGGHDELEAT